MTGEAVRTWLPYCGAAPLPADLLARWNLDPLLLLALLAGTLALWRLAPDGRGRRAAGAAGALALFLFVSPFCALSSALFAARVTHHVILSAILAPLVVLALPRGRMSLPGGLAAWTALQALAFWLWHAPPVYAAALSSDTLYWVMQLSILGTAIAFWAALRQAGSIAAIAMLLVSTVQMGLLGALITFAGHPLYAPHFATTMPWGLSPLDDQQLAGLVMWAPAAALYLFAALALARRSLAQSDAAA